MVHKLCVRSLQCGLGSMDYLHSMLIMEDDNDSDTESEHFDVYSETPQESESTDSQHASAVTGPAPTPSAASNSLPCCKCSVCIVMVREDVLQHLQSSASFVWTQMCWSFVLENERTFVMIGMITVQGPSGRLHAGNLFLICCVMFCF